MDCRMCQPAREAHAEGPSPVTPWHEIWACDAPRPEENGPVFTIDCPACDDILGSSCPHCEDGQYPIRRCPMKLLGSSEVRAVQDFALLKLGHLPRPGGFMDQPAPWVAKMEHLMAASGRIESDRIKAVEAKNKRKMAKR